MNICDFHAAMALGENACERRLPTAIMFTLPFHVDFLGPGFNGPAYA